MVDGRERVRVRLDSVRFSDSLLSRFALNNNLLKTLRAGAAVLSAQRVFLWLTLQVSSLGSRES